METSAGESIDEQIEKIVNIPDLSSIGSAEVHSEVKLSEEGTRGVSASIAFKSNCHLFLCFLEPCSVIVG